MKLETGKKYKLRNGCISGPMKPTGYPDFPFCAVGPQGVHVDWREDGAYSENRAEHPFDIVAEYPEPETTEQYIRRLEHNIEVMRDSYLPARLEIAARAMAAMITDHQYAPYNPEMVAKEAFRQADALIAEYQKTEPQ